MAKESTKHTRRYCLALDLKDDSELIAAYKQYHQQVWPEVLDSIRSSGIKTLDIYLTGNRLVMIMEVDETFSFSAKQKMDENNPKVQDWETLMWKYQKALPHAKEGEKWLLMEKIFEL